MSIPDWQRLANAFATLRALDPATQRVRLAELGEDQPEFADRLRRMLDRAEALPEPTGPPSLAEPSPGERVGPWLLDERIGAGGMGAVYRGRRADGAYDQVVAIKTLRPELASGDFRARFRQESRILARLEHPAIARLLDAGSSDEGVPFLVMEYVTGELLLEWRQRRRPGLAERLRLLVRLADAVQHAHSRLIVHRDLKPGNVMVRPDGEPVLLDFGIGRLLDDEGQGGETGIMTPEFASPEQLRGEPVGTASDVYSLGVLAYHLLAEAAPYVEVSGPESLVRSICDGRVTPPSARAGSLRLRRDVDLVLLRAMAVDPERRYPSAEAFGDDLAAIVEHRPVAARGDSAGYRFGRFLRRHPFSSAATAAATATLLGLVVALQAQVSRTEEALARAERESATSGAVADFLVDLFDAADPMRLTGKPVAVRDLLDRGLFQLDRLPEDPALRSRIEATMGEVYFNLGDYETARSLVGDALAFAGPADSPALRSLLGEVEHALGNRAEAERLLRDALAASDDVATRLRLAVLLRDVGQLEDAAALLDDAIAELRAGGDAKLLDRALTQRGAVHWLAGDMDAAEPFYREALDLQASWLPADHPRRAVTLSALSTLAHRRADFAAASELGEAALAIQSERLGPDHATTARTAANLGAMYLDAGDPERAEAHLLAARDAQAPRDDPALTNTLNNLGLLYLRGERFEDAIQALADTVERMDATLPADHPQLAAATDNLGLALLQAGRHEAARARLEAGLAMRTRSLPADHHHLAYSHLHLGMLALREDDLAAADDHLGEALAIREAALGPDHPEVATTLLTTADLRAAQGRMAEVADLLSRALAIRIERLGPDAAGTNVVRERLAGLDAAVRPDSAVETDD